MYTIETKTGTYRFKSKEVAEKMYKELKGYKVLTFIKD